MARRGFLARGIRWLRAGYPDGAPPRCYVPLLALLGSQLTNDEVTLAARELAFSSAPDSAGVLRQALSVVTRGAATGSDVARVRSHLAAGGWPLTKPDRT
jgi:hypothetical protein